MKKKLLFINIKSFLNTTESIYEIQIETDKVSRDILVNPRINITSMMEKHFEINKKNFSNAKSLQLVWSNIKDKYPKKYYSYISYRLGSISYDLDIKDFY